MWKLDTCAGHEALIIELLERKPPGIMSADGTSSMCEQCASRPLRALWEKGYGKKEKQKIAEV